MIIVQLLSGREMNNYRANCSFINTSPLYNIIIYLLFMLSQTQADAFNILKNCRKNIPKTVKITKRKINKRKIAPITVKTRRMLASEKLGAPMADPD